MEGKIFDEISGEKATFAVKVLYSQNSTWQGTVRWLEAGEEVNFRSDMELMQIIEGALSPK